MADFKAYPRRYLLMVTQLSQVPEDATSVYYAPPDDRPVMAQQSPRKTD